MRSGISAISKKPEAFPNLWLTGGRVCVYGENMNGRILKLYNQEQNLFMGRRQRISFSIC